MWSTTSENTSTSHRPIELLQKKNNNHPQPAPALHNTWLYLITGSPYYRLQTESHSRTSTLIANQQGVTTWTQAKKAAKWSDWLDSFSFSFCSLRGAGEALKALSWWSEKGGQDVAPFSHSGFSSCSGGAERCCLTERKGGAAGRPFLGSGCGCGCGGVNGTTGNSPPRAQSQSKQRARKQGRSRSGPVLIVLLILDLVMLLVWLNLAPHRSFVFMTSRRDPTQPLDFLFIYSF